MPRILTATISKLGAVVIKATGFTGTACQAATARYEAALGAVTADESTPEMLATEAEAGLTAEA